MAFTLDDMLDGVSVMPPGMWENDTGPKDWYAVADEEHGIIAYFANEEDAFGFRLTLINARLNHVTTAKRYARLDRQREG